MVCPHYAGLRNVWRAAVQALVPQLEFKKSNLRRLVIVDKTWEPDTRIKVVKELAKFVLATRRKI